MRRQAHRAPGIPCALRPERAASFRQTSRETRGEIAGACLIKARNNFVSSSLPLAIRYQSPGGFAINRGRRIFHPGARGDRHGQGSDAQQQGKEEAEGRQEPEKGRAPRRSIRSRPARPRPARARTARRTDGSGFSRNSPRICRPSRARARAAPRHRLPSIRFGASHCARIIDAIDPTLPPTAALCPVDDFWRDGGSWRPQPEMPARCPLQTRLGSLPRYIYRLWMVLYYRYAKRCIDPRAIRFTIPPGQWGRIRDGRSGRWSRICIGSAC